MLQNCICENYVLNLMSVLQQFLYNALMFALKIKTNLLSTHVTKKTFNCKKKLYAVMTSIVLRHCVMQRIYVN